eukprot:gb/GECG01002913.1/.p1 GENE.gb/GECG01002913.1/~~gb/GECG01002913.1/.p1  ORF type:complete len:213 (+),score=40.15 gb/GECG01002913.1/:1-639(+)
METTDSIWALSGGPPIFNPYEKHNRSSTSSQTISYRESNSTATHKRGLDEDGNDQGRRKGTKRQRTTVSKEQQEGAVSSSSETEPQPQPPRAALYDMYGADKLESRWKEEYDKIVHEEQGTQSSGSSSPATTRPSSSSSSSSQQNRPPAAAAPDSNDAPVARRTRSKRRQSVNNLLEEIQSEKSTTEHSLKHLSERVKEGKRQKVQQESGNQ